jgi:hypothetical protein
VSVYENIEAQGYHFQHLLWSNLKHIIVNCRFICFCCRMHNLTLIRYVPTRRSERSRRFLIPGENVVVGGVTSGGRCLRLDCWTLFYFFQIQHWTDCSFNHCKPHWAEWRYLFQFYLVPTFIEILFLIWMSRCQEIHLKTKVTCPSVFKFPKDT